MKIFASGADKSNAKNCNLIFMRLSSKMCFFKKEFKMCSGKRIIVVMKVDSCCADNDRRWKNFEIWLSSRNKGGIRINLKFEIRGKCTYLHKEFLFPNSISGPGPDDMEYISDICGQPTIKIENRLTKFKSLVNLANMRPPEKICSNSFYCT